MSQKLIGEEHINFDQYGNVLGLYTIDAVKAREHYGKSRYWEGVDDLVRTYSRINLGEIAAVVKENTDVKQSAFNRFTSNNAGNFRQALTLPQGLYNLLETYDPTFFTNKKMLHEFMRLYPQLRACETL
jgi:hypothetical protein